MDPMKKEKQCTLGCGCHNHGQTADGTYEKQIVSRARGTTQNMMLTFLASKTTSLRYKSNFRGVRSWNVVLARELKAYLGVLHFRTCYSKLVFQHHHNLLGKVTKFASREIPPLHSEPEVHEIFPSNFHPNLLKCPKVFNTLLWFSRGENGLSTKNVEKNLDQHSLFHGGIGAMQAGIDIISFA